MTFSIVIPTFNASNTIVKTLDSCVYQTFLPKEIIVIDDCSQDDSVKIVNEYMKKYKGSVEIKFDSLQKNSGPSVARNRAWDLATGEYVAFLDADDCFVSSKLEVISLILEKNKEIILLGHDYSLDDQDIHHSNDLKKIVTKDLLLKNLTTTPSVIVKKNIKERFDENMRYTEDHDLWLRITKKYNKTYYLNRVLTMIDRPVRSKGGQSSNLWGMRKGEIIMYYKYCKTNRIMLVFPLFLGFSLSKHLMKMIKGYL